MLFKIDVHVDILDKTENYLDFVINVCPTSKKWRLTGFYGHPKVKDYSWEWLRKLSKVNNLPWIIFGDFNEILDKDDKSGGRLKRLPKMTEFKELVDNCYLHDLHYEGCIFTWRRDKIKQRLDRAFVTLEWKDIFHLPRVLHMPTGDISHHILIVIQTDSRKQKKVYSQTLDDAMVEVISFVERWKNSIFR